MFPSLRHRMNDSDQRTTRRAPVKGRPTRRLRTFLEPLEARLVPATLTWTGAVSELWSDYRNWVGGITPYVTPEADDLIFPRAVVPHKVSKHDLPLGTPISSITFDDSGYTLTGGNILFGFEAPSRIGTIRVNAPSGTNSIQYQRLFIGPGATVHVSRDSQLNVLTNIESSEIYGSGPLVKAGAGALSLSGNSSYRGGTEVREGTLLVGSNTGLGFGTLRLVAGTFQSSGPVTLANPVDAVHPFSHISGSNEIILTGSVQILPGATLTVANTAESFVSILGTIFGPGSLRKTGSGYLDLYGNNTYEGGTDIQESVLLLSNERALGRGRVRLSGGELFVVIDGATLANPFEVSGGTISTNNIGFDPLGVTFTGAGELLPGATLTVETGIVGDARPRPLTFSGPLSGAGGLTIDADGMVILSGTAANTYAGMTTVEAGTLVLEKPAGVTAIAGPLVIGDNAGGPNPFLGVVELGAADQIGDKVPITVNVNGLLKLNHFNDKYGPLTGKGKVTTGDPPTMTVAFDDLRAVFEGEISGPGIVVKEGTGTWILTGVNTYEGGTFVEDGTLLVEGSILGPVTVGAGAALGGTGTTGPVTLGPGAAVSPGGAAPGVQSTRDLVFSPGSSYVVQLDGPDPGTGYDQLDVTGAVSLNEATLDASPGFSPAPGRRFVIIRNDGTDPVSGNFAGLPQGTALRIGGVPFRIVYDGGDGNDVELVRNVPPAVTVPGDQVAFQNVELALGGFLVGDPDDASLTVLLQVSRGTLTLGAVGGLSVSGNGTSSVSLSGGIADLNAALVGLVYLGDRNFSGPDLLTVTATDTFDTTSASVAVRVKSLAEQAADLRARVNALRDAGVLNKGRANSLLVKLDLKNNHGDIGRVQAFLNEVGALLNACILSPAQADRLLGLGTPLLTGLRRR